MSARQTGATDTPGTLGGNSLSRTPPPPHYFMSSSLHQSIQSYVAVCTKWEDQSKSLMRDARAFSHKYQKQRFKYDSNDNNNYADVTDWSTRHGRDFVIKRRKSSGPRMQYLRVCCHKTVVKCTEEEKNKNRTLDITLITIC